MKLRTFAKTLAAAVLLPAGFVALGTSSASADSVPCGSSDASLWIQTVPAGYSTYTIDHRVARYHNCGDSSVSVRPDIAFQPDPPCRTVAPGEVAKWDFQVTSNNPLPVHLRGAYSC